jgi:hypothetical protein
LRAQDRRRRYVRLGVVEHQGLAAVSSSI